ncbi:MAG: ABC transporter permease [Clostridia bacterium]|nr:ABC transporter permease [Clostridia bacterium]
MTGVIKSTFKLMLRNKVFLFFLLLVPIFTTLILELINFETPTETSAPSSSVIELPSCDERSIYYAQDNGNAYAFNVKVFDASCSELSEYVLAQLADNKMFNVCRAKAGGLTEEKILAQAEFDAFNDRAGCIIYLKSDFDNAVMEGDLDNAMQLFVVSEDERFELFELELSDMLRQINAAQTVCGSDTAAIIEMLDNIEENMPAKKTVSVTGKNAIRLTAKQGNQLDAFTTASTFSMMSFLFAGLFIAHTVIEEKNNKVFTRIMLSKVGTAKYFIGKAIAMVFVDLLQVTFLLFSFLTIYSTDFGLSLFELMIIMLPQGMVFSAIGLTLGALIGDMMSSNYVGFALWSVSSLLSGSFFSMDDATGAMKAMSSVMPQKLYNDAAKMFLTGDNSGYSVVLLSTAAFLLVIFCIGSVGLKMQKQEQ